MLDLSTEQNFKPLLNPRRSEVIAWVFFTAIVGILIFIPTTGFVRIGGYFLAFFFFFSAVVMTMANWQNRRMLLSLSADGIRFENGLQTITMPWEKIRQVEVYPGRVNDKIVVKDADQRFAFDMYKEVVVKGKVTGKVGFEQGEQILETIFHFADIDVSEKHHAEGYDYYSRK
ncbi:hypothetical protein KQH54_03495 [bacterium]|nr:hypothetical protein [bacterium]